MARAQQTDVSGLQHILEQAQAEQKNGDLAAAARDYKAALQVDPGFAEVRVNLGLVYQLQDRLPEAMDEFAKALKIRPTLPGANFFLGVDYCKVGQSAKGIPYLEGRCQRAAGKERYLDVAGNGPGTVRANRRSGGHAPARFNDFPERRGFPLQARDCL